MPDIDLYNGANTGEDIDANITEVQNARTGNDGTAYQTLKARIDTEIYQLQSHFEESVAVDPNDFTKYSWGISASTGKWSNASKWKGIFIPIDETVEKVTVTASSESNSTVAMLKTTPTEHNSTPDYATGGSKVLISAGESAEFIIPNDCHYFYVLVSYESGDRTPQSIVELKKKD